jgi:adenine-specific DNA methylase
MSDGKSFIEVQFPVSKLSKESYRERKAVAGQTLTGLGKWWGRKPLILVRAAILGLLLPATDDPDKDREVFLKLLTMDDEGLVRRLKGSITAADTYSFCTDAERERYFEAGGTKVRWTKGLVTQEKRSVQGRAFRRMGYDEKLKHCVRPEEIDGPSPEAWGEINAHLGTDVLGLPELVAELGHRRFGHVPRIGDAFCGGGSIPFEAARLGCIADASDLNPIAALLTHAALSLAGGPPDRRATAEQVERNLYAGLSERIEELGIERNERGWVAEAFLYCAEVTDPMSGWRVPLAGSWVVAPRGGVVAQLRPIVESRSFEIAIVSGCSSTELQAARNEGTWDNGVVSPVDSHGNWVPPESRLRSSFDVLRGRNGLRRWGAGQFVATERDVFAERLYCIRWYEPSTGRRVYAAPTCEDTRREVEVLRLLELNSDDWRRRGYIPDSMIDAGGAIGRPTRGRGWSHWHHLFNPRQLVVAAIAAEVADRICASECEGEVAALLIGRLVNWNSRLCRWDSSKGGGIGGGSETFYQPALNTPFANYVSRGVRALEPVLRMHLSDGPTARSGWSCELCDARTTVRENDVWMTDPGYADKVAYEQLSEFFLAWQSKRIPALFPSWYADSRRSLAVRGRDEDFRRAMVECYRRFTERMPENGLQLVMFTHQDAEVWADLALVLWAAGLQVTAAWTVATETGSAGIRQGDFVQGTVLLVLRKRHGDLHGDMSDLFPDVQSEVQRQLEAMLDLEDQEDPNFSDADYQLAAYAAALRVLTAYSAVDEIDAERDLFRARAKGERSPLAGLIERAVKIASEFLIPDGLDRRVWKSVGPEERFYLKGVEIEAHGEYREGVYQEFARGFGVNDYTPLLASTAANQTRLRTPSEFKGRDLQGSGFPGTLLRKLLFAIFTTAQQPDHDPRPARTYLKQDLADYWERRQLVISLLTYLSEKPKPFGTMSHWQIDVEAARLLRGSIEGDSA